jgi:hypothetical protein
MHHDDPYETWKRRRARARVPPEFADRVLNAVRERERQRAERWLWLRALLWSRPAQVGLTALACAACVFRILQILGLFLGNVVQ